MVASNPDTQNPGDALPPTRIARVARSDEDRRNINTLVVRGVHVLVKVVHDPDLPDAWDDSCRLFTTDDDGETYSTQVLLNDEELTRREGRWVWVLFKNVIPDMGYSLFLDLGKNADGRSAGGMLVFHDHVITEQMAVDGLPEVEEELEGPQETQEEDSEDENAESDTESDDGS